uniref:Uncharacterized protein n=1 Tax=Anopheles atroparvus TaxID=41427 RepID=A0A182J970_ANOAO
MEKYKIIKKIGEGSYGAVYAGHIRSTCTKVAVKRINIIDKPGSSESVCLEISMLKALKHPNVVSLLDVQVLDKSACLVMEYLWMDLFNYMYKKKTSDRMVPLRVKSYMFQITGAIMYCHKKSIMHRDLKPENLLIDKVGVIKVADFGLGCSFAVPQNYSNMVGKICYRAPEMLLGATSYSCSVDIWALGCIFAEMSASKLLFPGKLEIVQLLSIFSMLGTPTDPTWPGVTALPHYQRSFPRWAENTLEHAVANIDETGLDLLKKCLQCKPDARITANEMLNHKYFEGLKKNQR